MIILVVHFIIIFFILCHRIIQVFEFSIMSVEHEGFNNMLPQTLQSAQILFDFFHWMHHQPYSSCYLSLFSVVDLLFSLDHQFLYCGYIPPLHHKA